MSDEAPETPAPEATPAAPANPGPWSADLAEYLGDNPEAVAAADRYMREKVQPRITELEQDTGRALLKDLQANPTETLSYVVGEIYGEDVAAEFTKLFGEDGEGLDEEEAPETPAPKDDDEVRQWVLERKRQEADAAARKAGEEAYQEVLTNLRMAHPDLKDGDMELIHPFLATAADPEAAYAGYRKFTDSLKAHLGIEETPAPETPAPPAVLGSEGSTAAPPPTTKQYATIDEALDDYFAERRTPPPVI